MGRHRRSEAALLAGLAVVSLLPNPGAALPFRTYFFRDFTAAFYPLRLFAARELAAGRVPFWNPYLHEGTFAIPAFYPLDLLHALWPGPAAVSWLLTIHFPIAALGCYWLARELGIGRLGAFAAGSAYSMGGLALSTLNLYVFLQALALAPIAVAALRRAALRGGRWIAVTALALGSALSTLALEFVAATMILGIALCALAVSDERRPLRMGARVVAAVLLGAGLAAVPVAVVRGFLPETARGAGFTGEEALQFAAEPAHLLQGLVAGLLGPPDALLSDGRSLLLFGKLPYFVTLYMGPFVIASAVAGAGHGGLRRTARVLIVLALAGAWVALGARGGLAPLLLSLPGLEGFRYPSKALLLPYTAMALLAGAGIDRLHRGQGWRVLSAAGAGCALVSLAATLAIHAAGDSIARVFGVDPRLLTVYLPSAARECLVAASLAALVMVAAAAARRGALRPPAGALLLTILIVLDLARAGAFVNPQAPPGRFTLAPEIAAALDDGRRAFSHGIVSSPAFVRCATLRRRGIESWSPWVSRQVLAPYTNVIDGVATALTADLTALGPRIPEPTVAELRPEAVSRLLPRLREAAVTRVVSLDPLQDPGLRLLATVPLGLPHLAVHVYELSGSAPREEVSCDCGTASVLRRDLSTDSVAFDVVVDAAGLLVVRDTYARGWTATVDGSPAPVRRAGASHRAVVLSPGRHEVVMRYRPPGLALGLAVCVVAAALTVGRLIWPLPRRKVLSGPG